MHLLHNRACHISSGATRGCRSLVSRAVPAQRTCSRQHSSITPLICSASTGSSSSSNGPAPAPASPSSRTRKQPGNKTNPNTSTSTPSASSAVVAAASVTTVVVEEEVEVVVRTAAPPSEQITLANPPLGFTNNIVPTRTMVVTPPPAGAPVVDSSDEELDESPQSTSPSSGVGGPVGGGTGRSSAWRCLVLDSRYLPVNVVNWGRAVAMDMSGKVDVLEYHPGGYAYSAYRQHPLPAVLRVQTFVDVHEFAGRLALTRKNIMLRDHHRCQYCGSTKELTLDHIKPVCRGGLNSWQNLVTACMACNQRKGDKSLQQLGWKLPCVPREPTPGEVGVVAGISKSDLEHPPLPWAPYLELFKASLEKAQKRAAAAASSNSSSSSSAGALAGELVGSKAGAAAVVAAAAATATASASGGSKASTKKASRRIRH